MMINFLKLVEALENKDSLQSLFNFNTTSLLRYLLQLTNRWLIRSDIKNNKNNKRDKCALIFFISLFSGMNQFWQIIISCKIAIFQTNLNIRALLFSLLRRGTKTFLFWYFFGMIKRCKFSVIWTQVERNNKNTKWKFLTTIFNLNVLIH